MTHPARPRRTRSRSSSGGCCSTTRFPLDGERRHRPRLRPPRLRAAGRDRRLADRALRARAAVRRLHGGRPRPPPRLARLGGARPREQRRRGLPDPRRRARRAAQARRGRTATRRNVLVVSDHGGGSLSGVVNLNAWLAAARAGSPTATSRARATAASAATSCSSCAAGCPKHCATRSSSGCRGCASGPTGCARLLDRRLAPHAGVLLRDRSATSCINVARPRARRDRRAGRGVRAAARRDRASGRSSCARRDGEPIVAAVHRREDLFAGAELEQDPRPDRRVPRLRLARQGQPDRARTATRSGTRSRSAPHTGQVYAGSHRHEGIFVLAGPAARAARGAARRRDRGRRADGALPARRADSRRRSRAGCWPRRSSRRCSTSGRRSSTTRTELAPASHEHESAARGRGAATQPRLPRVARSARSRRYAPRSSTSPPGRAARSGGSGCSAASALASSSRSSTSVTSPAAAEPARERELVVVHGLAVPLQPRHDDRALPSCDDGQHRADACVADDDARPPDVLDELGAGTR